MAKVTARNEAVVARQPSDVAELLADYSARPTIQPANYSAFRIVSGGVGDGTVAAWHLQATKKRSRDVEVEVTAIGDPEQVWTLTERDKNSSMVTEYVVSPAPGQQTSLVVETTWDGAGGIGGIFEGLFAPKGLQRIQQQQIDLLEERLAELST